MSLQQDIKDSLTAYGSTLSIRRSPTNLVEVYDTEPIYQASKPFRLEHISQFTSPYDSDLIVGDLADDTLGTDTYIIMHVDQDIVGNEIISKSVIGYKTNSTITISRLSKSGKSYNPTNTWPPFVTSYPAVIDDTAYAAKLDTQPIPYQNIQEKVIYFYIPTSVGVEVGDRIKIDNLLYGTSSGGVMLYEVTTIDYFTFLGISILHTKEDSRA